MADRLARMCRGCWEQMRVPVPLRGVMSAPFRAFGVKPSKMNPNTCTICEMMFSKVMKARQVTIDATVLFADLRGYTGLSQSRSTGSISEVLDAFYDACAESIWEHDGLLNKTMGDAVMAVFNFPLRRPDHPSQAIQAGRKIQERWRARREMLVAHADESAIGVGVGIDCGEVSFGEFGRSHQDLTAIGNVVNRASRAQAAAKSEEILVTKAVHDRAAAEVAQVPARDYSLKGFERPIQLWAV
jgi:adenylate cyclase